MFSHLRAAAPAADPRKGRTVFGKVLSSLSVCLSVYLAILYLFIGPTTWPLNLQCVSRAAGRMSVCSCGKQAIPAIAGPRRTDAKKKILAELRTDIIAQPPQSHKLGLFTHSSLNLQCSRQLQISRTNPRARSQPSDNHE